MFEVKGDASHNLEERITAYTTKSRSIESSPIRALKPQRTTLSLQDQQPTNLPSKVREKSTRTSDLHPEEASLAKLTESDRNSSVFTIGTPPPNDSKLWKVPRCVQVLEVESETMKTRSPIMARESCDSKHSDISKRSLEKSESVTESTVRISTPEGPPEIMLQWKDKGHMPATAVGNDTNSQKFDFQYQEVQEATTLGYTTVHDFSGSKAQLWTVQKYPKTEQGPKTTAKGGGCFGCCRRQKKPTPIVKVCGHRSTPGGKKCRLVFWDNWDVEAQRFRNFAGPRRRARGFLAGNPKTIQCARSCGYRLAIACAVAVGIGLLAVTLLLALPQIHSIQREDLLLIFEISLGVAGLAASLPLATFALWPHCVCKRRQKTQLQPERPQIKTDIKRSRGIRRNLY